METNKEINNTLVFPLRDPASKAEAQNRGISLLDYFIAHAPMEPQWEFYVPMKTERPMPIFKKIGGISVSNNLKNGEDIQKWIISYNEKQAKMWPAEWAKSQLIERLKYL